MLLIFPFYMKCCKKSIYDLNRFLFKTFGRGPIREKRRGGKENLVQVKKYLVHIKKVQ